jgi:hypothetical protein
MTNWTEEQLETVLKNNASLRVANQDRRTEPSQGVGVGKVEIVQQVDAQAAGERTQKALFAIRTHYRLHAFAGNAQLAEKVIRSKAHGHMSFTEKRFIEDILIGNYSFPENYIFFEPCSFVLPSQNKYSPDFAVIIPNGQYDNYIKFFEVKWKRVLNRDSQIRYAWAKHEFRMFPFEAWQLTKKEGWKEIWT